MSAQTAEAAVAIAGNINDPKIAGLWFGQDYACEFETRKRSYRDKNIGSSGIPGRMRKAGNVMRLNVPNTTHIPNSPPEARVAVYFGSVSGTWVCAKHI